MRLVHAPAESCRNDVRGRKRRKELWVGSGGSGGAEGRKGAQIVIVAAVFLFVKQGRFPRERSSRPSLPGTALIKRIFPQGTAAQIAPNPNKIGSQRNGGREVTPPLF